MSIQRITLSQAEPVKQMIGAPGIISISGTFGSADVRVSPTDFEDLSLNTNVLPVLGRASGSSINNPVAGPACFNVNAERLTFTALGANATTDVTVTWQSVRQPY